MEIYVVKKNDTTNDEEVEHGLMPNRSPQPFIKKNTRGTNKSQNAALHPELPRRIMEIPGGPSRSDHMISISNDANTLTVGKNISLNGEIVACEKLIVEGTVEAKLNDANIIEVCQGGCFKGSADVTTASISGKFIGNLVAKDILTIHQGGHVEGSIRYGRIIIEAGGQITGDMSSLEFQKRAPAEHNDPTD